MAHEASDFDATLALVERAQQGERQALEALFDRYLPRVRQIVALRLGRRLSELVEHEDLVQESLLQAFRQLGGFRPAGEGSFRNWLATLVENRIRDAARRAGAQRRGEGRVRPMAAYESGLLASSVLPGHDTTPSQHADARETEQRLELALLSLPERDRRAIELRRLCGLDFAEIALALGLKGESSARSLFSRALARLAERL